MGAQLTSRVVRRITAGKGLLEGSRYDPALALVFSDARRDLLRGRPVPGPRGRAGADTGRRGMTAELVRLEGEGAVARLVLDRPDRGHAWRASSAR
jgi:hypothetical protein